MKKTKQLLFFVSAIVTTLLFASCEKDNDKAIVLPPIDTTMSSMQVSMGVNYDTMIFVNLTTGDTKYSAIKDYDLAFEASPQGQYIYLNTGKYMFAWRSASTGLANTDTTGLVWATDADTWLGDSTAFGKNKDAAGNSNNTVVVIDRGKYNHFGSDRYRKLQIVSISSSDYVIRYSKLDNSDYHEFTVPKDDSYSLMYFSFTNGGTMVSLAPPKDQWDIVFTRYIHTYWEETLQFRFYLVNGTMTNRWNETTCAILKKDSVPGYKPFGVFNHNDIANFTFYNDANVMGFDWKDFDFNTNMYYIVPDLFYVIKNHNGEYYKLKYYDFYNAQGLRGCPAFQYQRIL